MGLGAAAPSFQHNPVARWWVPKWSLAPPGFLTGRGDQSSSGPQPVGGATGTGPPVRVRVRSVGGQPDPGPLQFQGAGPGPKPACLVLSPSSGPLSGAEPPEERPQVQMHPQQGGACGAAACSEACPPALAGQGRGWGWGGCVWGVWGLRSPRRPHCSLGPIARPGSPQPHVGPGGEPPGPWSSRLPGLGQRLLLLTPGPASLTSLWMPVPA